jgi:hypothetical protein
VVRYLCRAIKDSVIRRRQMSHTMCVQQFFPGYPSASVKRLHGYESLRGPVDHLRLPPIHTHAQWCRWCNLFPSLPQQRPSVHPTLRCVVIPLWQFGDGARCTLIVRPESGARARPSSAQCPWHTSDSQYVYLLTRWGSLVCRTLYDKTSYATVVYLKLMPNPVPSKKRSRHGICRHRVRFCDPLVSAPSLFELICTLGPILTPLLESMSADEPYSPTRAIYGEYDDHNEVPYSPSMPPFVNRDKASANDLLSPTFDSDDDVLYSPSMPRVVVDRDKASTSGLFCLTPDSDADDTSVHS